jgi:hypothetical protein
MAVPTFNTREEYEAWKAARMSGAAGAPAVAPGAPPPPPPVAPPEVPGVPPALYDPHQQVLDQEHLRLLRIGYLVSAGMTLLLCFLGFFYVAMGAFMSSVVPAQGARGAPPFPIFGFFAAFGAVFIVVGAGLAVLKFFTARAIQLRNGYVLCMVAAAIACLEIPYGTLLGISTFVVLGRPHVKAMFGAS